MRPLIVAILALAPALALAEPTPITSLDQVQRLCADLQTGANHSDALGAAHGSADAKARRDQAMKGEYTLTLPPGQYKISEADASTGTLSLDTQRAFRLFKGQAVFYPVDDEDLDLAVPEGQALPKDTNDLSLELVVRPGQDAEQACTQGLAKDYVMGVEVLAARLVNKGGQTVAKLEEDQSVERQASASGAPAVTVEPAVVEGSASMSKQVTDGVNALKPKLTECYQQGLQRQPALDGSLVLGFDLSREGRPGPVTVMADSVQDDSVARCVSEAISGLSVSKSAAPAKNEVKTEKGKKGAAATTTSAGSRASVAVRFERK